MLGFRKRDKVEVGPDGMTDFSRQMHRQWARRDAVMAEVHAEVAKRTGIDADLVPHLPSEFLTLAVVLGVKLKD